MEKVFDYVDKNVAKWVDNLSEAVKIKSVSAWTETRPEVDRMVQWVGDRLKTLGASIELCEVGFQVN